MIIVASTSKHEATIHGGACYIPACQHGQFAVSPLRQVVREQPLTGLLVSHRGAHCGVYQFGRRLCAMLASAPDIVWQYAECATFDDFAAAERELRPDVVLLNFHPDTLTWAIDASFECCDGVVFAVFHEAHQAAADRIKPNPFRYLICPDPTLLPRNPIVLPVPRFIPEPIMVPGPAPATFTVGSFGFATPGKGFERICELANKEFETARIRINIPFHDVAEIAPRETLDAIIADCRGRITKPGIKLEITHEFFDDAALLDFLAENTVNAFLYDGGEGRGIASCTDYALSCGRPIAISSSPMFRHLHRLNPSICVEDRSLAAIAAAGADNLNALRQAYGATASGAAWTSAIRRALTARARSQSVPDKRGFNKVLDDRSRSAYKAALTELSELAPEILARKIPRANVQQAFALDAVERLLADLTEPRILAIGSFEDTAVAALKAKGFRIDEVDPNFNGVDLESFYRSPEAVLEFYDLILCVSVLEHVEDDEGFVRMVADLLAPDGIAIFTVDFSNSYPADARKPAIDRRLYNTRDLRDRLMAIMPDCCLVDVPSWNDGSSDFEYDGCNYAFASWVFRKLNIRRVLNSEANGSATHWKVQSAAQSAEIERLQKLIAAQSAEIERLQKLIAAQSAEIERLQKLIAAPSAEIERLQKLIAAQSAEIERLQKLIAAPSAEIERLQKLIAAQSAEIERLQKLS